MGISCRTKPTGECYICGKKVIEGKSFIIENDVLICRNCYDTRKRQAIDIKLDSKEGVYNDN